MSGNKLPDCPFCGDIMCCYNLDKTLVRIWMCDCEDYDYYVRGGKGGFEVVRDKKMEKRVMDGGFIHCAEDRESYEDKKMSENHLAMYEAQVAIREIMEEKWEIMVYEHEVDGDLMCKLAITLSEIPSCSITMESNVQWRRDFIPVEVGEPEKAIMTRVGGNHIIRGLDKTAKALLLLLFDSHGITPSVIPDTGINV